MSKIEFINTKNKWKKDIKDYYYTIDMEHILGKEVGVENGGVESTPS